MDVFKIEFKCVICNQFAISPLHNCKSGHLICGICSFKAQQCVFPCEQREDTFELCKVAERILKEKEVEIPCRNVAEGCTKVILPSLMKIHMQSDCAHRSIICDLFPKDLCGVIELRDVYTHLSEVHDIINEDNMKAIPGKFSELHIFETGHLAIDFPVAIQVKTFDKNTFLFLQAVKKGQLYQQIAVIGDKLIADEYKYVITSSPEVTTNIGKVNSIGRRRITRQKIEFPQGSKFITDQLYAVLPLKDVNLRGWFVPTTITYNLNKLCTLPEYTYEWTDQFEIIKANSLNSN